LWGWGELKGGEVTHYQDHFAGFKVLEVCPKTSIGLKKKKRRMESWGRRANPEAQRKK